MPDEELPLGAAAEDEAPPIDDGFEGDDQEPAAAAAKPKPDATAEEKPLTAAERREIADAKREAAVLKEQLNFFKQMAERAQVQPKPAAKEEPGEIDPDAFIEQFAKDPKKAIRDLTRQIGLASKDEVAELATQKARELVEADRTLREKDEEIYADYPQLRQRDSDFYRDTAEALRQMVGNDPEQAANPAMIRAAALVAKAKEEARGAGGGSRRERIAAQSPAGTARSGDGGSPRMSPLQASMAKFLKVPTDAYANELKAIKGGRRAG